MSNELQPTLAATVDLDGDDDAQIQTENARYAFDLALAKMKADGLIRDYTLINDPVQKPDVVRPCPRCHGSGIYPERVGNSCWACGGSGEEELYLCGACGAIRPKLDFSPWKRDDEGDHWIPSEDGDGDPMLRCPACGDEHRDSDDDSGLEEGTLAELVASRAETVSEYGEHAFQSEYQPDPLPS